MELRRSIFQLFLFFIFTGLFDGAPTFALSSNQLRRSLDKKDSTEYFLETNQRKRHASDWETLLDQEEALLRRLLSSRQRPSDRYFPNDEFDLFDYPIHKSNKFKPKEKDEMEEAIDRLSEQKEESTTIRMLTTTKEELVERAARLQSNSEQQTNEPQHKGNDTLFFVIISMCSVIGVAGLVASAIFWYKIQQQAGEAADSDYPSYGLNDGNQTGHRISPSSTMSDRKLAQSAQMFHYQQQRQQMMAQEKARLDPNPNDSDDSDEETEAGGDYTVYECPGLAPTGEMEVRNPLFAAADVSLNLTDQSFSQPITTNDLYAQSSEPMASTSTPKENQNS